MNGWVDQAEERETQNKKKQSGCVFSEWRRMSECVVLEWVERWVGMEGNFVDLLAPGLIQGRKELLIDSHTMATAP